MKYCCIKRLQIWKLLLLFVKYWENLVVKILFYYFKRQKQLSKTEHFAIFFFDLFPV